MLSISRKIDRIFKSLYRYEDKEIKCSVKLKEIMSSNETRLEYLNFLLERANQNHISPECRKVIEDNIVFINEFMNGNLNTEFTVPEKYNYDKEKCLIIPTEDELEYLFHLIKSNKEMYDLLYKDKTFRIELPDNSFNQKMSRVLEIHEHNLAHLLGLTDSEPTPDPNKNQLKKYFLENVPNINEYGNTIAEALLNWILSEEGKTHLIELNNSINNFVEEDREKYPNNYESNGKIKLKSLEKFRERFRNEFGFNYPIIKFSRYMNKCINTFNFFNMNNINQMILDYNAPIGRNDEKDIFVVNCSLDLMKKSIKDYNEFRDYILDLLKKYALTKDETVKEELEYLNINLNDKDISSYINMLETNAYLEENDIHLDLTVFNEKIMNIINECCFSDIHLIGFDTVFEKAEIPVNKKTVNKAHCDTSISLKVGELVDDYYKRGRAFFLDKISDKSGSSLIRLSNPMEEMLYLQIEGKSCASLIKKLIAFNRNSQLFIEKNRHKINIDPTDVKPKSKIENRLKEYKEYLEKMFNKKSDELDKNNGSKKSK